MTEESDNVTVGEIESITDPAERARVATRLLASHQAAVLDLARIRRRAVAELRAEGRSLAQVAQELGVTRGRVAQLETGGQMVPREFFGGLDVTIITPLRSGADRPLVAQEDFEAASRLARFLEGAEIDVTFGHASVEGEVDLSPAAVVAICGPKSSHVIATAMQGDPNLRYWVDGGGRWWITDRSADERHGSPMDDSEPTPRDIAYVARLKRPNDDGHFVSIAGVHAIGSLGAVHWLTEPANLGALHAAVGHQPFSMVIRSEFTRSPLAIHQTEVIVEPMVHET